MDHHPTPPPPPAAAATTTMTPKTATPTSGHCGNCGADVQFFLHHVRLRGIHRRLCTKCVLLLHPQSFCPVCFAFYDSNPPHPSKRLSCSKCSSFTHSYCATSSSSSSISQHQQPYICPPCSDPNKSFAFFSNPKSESSTDASSGMTQVGRVIDGESAGVMLCACKIASASMGKAVLVARIEAEKKAKDAASARKRAREALEKVALLINKSNNNNNNNYNNNNNSNNGNNKEPQGSVVQISGSAASFFNAVNNKQEESMSQDDKQSISQELINKVNLQTDK